MSGRIIYEEGYAGETALLIRVPEKGLGGHNPGESRRDSEVWGQEEEQERKGEEKKAGAPSAQAGTGGGSGAGTVRESDPEATWALRNRPCFGGFLNGSLDGLCPRLGHQGRARG